MAVKRFLLLTLVFSVMLTTAPVLADGDFYVVAGGGGVGTKITYLPHTINSAGFYYLGKDLTSTGYGIIINVNNVTIDLMGFSINGSGGNVLQGIEMYGRNNVEVRNGTVKSFYYGIQEHQAEGSNHRIVNVRCLGNILTGISLAGNNHLIKGCTVTDSGNSSGGGIDLQGSGSVIGNTVYTSSGTGINLSTSIDNLIIVDQNTVSGTGTHYSGGSATTIWAGKSATYPYGNNAGAPLP
jgi:hypothetical protein